MYRDTVAESNTKDGTGSVCVVLRRDSCEYRPSVALKLSIPSVFALTRARKTFFRDGVGWTESDHHHGTEPLSLSTLVAEGESIFCDTEQSGVEQFGSLEGKSIFGARSVGGPASEFGLGRKRAVLPNLHSQLGGGRGRGPKMGEKENESLPKY